MRKTLLFTFLALLGLALCAPVAMAARVAPTDPGLPAGPSAVLPRSAAVAGVAGATDVQNLRTGSYFATIQAAIDDAGTLDGDVLEVQVASHAEGICAIGKAVTIRGGGGGAVITSTTDTGTSGDARAWFLVTVSGVTFQDLTFDGSANLIAQALRFYSGGTVANCAFQHIKRPASEYNGLAIVGFGNLSVTGCAFADCGRIGVILFGTDVTAGVVSGCTYTGKGDGDWLDYGVELGGGAVATITNNAITGCTGVALSDGSTSGGVLATTYYGAGTTATLTGNVLTGNSAGICAGYDASDVVVVTGHSNDLSGNEDVAIVNTSGTVTVDASANWWGDNTAAGLAAAVSGLVDYTPWLHNPGDVSGDAGFQGDYSVLDVDDDSPQTGTVARIQEAIGLVSGSTVNLSPGTYVASNTTVDRSLVLQGTGASRSDVVIVPAAEDGNADNAFANSAQNGLVIKAHDVTVRNLTLDGRGNPALTPGRNNFRAGIVTLDASQSGGGAWNNLHVDNVHVKYAYRRGISVFPLTVSGTLVENSRVEYIAFNHGMYLAGVSQALDNTVHHCFQGIVLALDATTPAGTCVVNGNTLTSIGNFPGCWGDQGGGVYQGQPRAIQFNNSNSAGRTVEIRDNVIDDGGSDGLVGSVGIYTRLANTASIVDHNTMTMTSGASWAVDGGSQSVGMLLGWSYAMGFTATNNTVNSSGYGIGVLVADAGVVAQPLVLEGNTLTSTGSLRSGRGDGAGVYIANEYLFAPTDKRDSYVIIRKGNVISGFVKGVEVERLDSSTYTVVAQVNGNSLAGNTTGIEASTLTATMDGGANWWGTATPAGVAALVSANVDYTPWLANGDASGNPGFQADYSTLWVDDSSPQTGSVARIQEGINLVSGSTVYLAPGSYAENVIVDKKIVLQGAGDGNDPLVDTILLPLAGTTGITIQAGGTGPTDRCVIRDLRVSGGQFGMYTLSTLGYLTLQNLTVTGATAQGFEINNLAVLNDVAMTDVDMVGNVSGMRVRGRLDGLVVTNGHFDGNTYGLQSYTGTGEGNNFLHVSITGTTFNNNASKGMYFEKLSDAVFDGITVANSGTAGAYAAGIDVNLKYADYQNVEIRNSSITGCGTGDLTNGVGVTVKARSDGSYSTYPATLTNVDLTGNTITGCQNGIRFGEPGKSNPGPTVVDVHECLITGSVGVGLDNASLNVPTATCNWWGDALGPDVPPYNPTSGDGISGSATWAPFWTTATGPCDGFVPYVTPVTAGLCISTAHPCVTVPVTFTRGDATEVRGVSVTFQLGGGLTLCDTPALSILQGTWLAAYSAQYGIVDNGGGSYTVDQAINGEPCGITTGGQLFTLALTATSDGTGTVTITEVAVRDCDNAPLPGTPGAPGSIPIDVTAPPAPTALTAAQDKTGNGPDGRTFIDVSWPAVEAGATVHVYRADYGNYPEYDDPPSAGSVPATPGAHPPVAPWVHVTDVTSGTTLADEPPTRGFWYYVAYVEDVCGNVSPASNMTGGTLDYHLGDVMGSDVCLGDNAVGTGDVSLLGGHYGVAEGHALYLACLDVGPTTNRSVNARPTTDNRINFEDMMMFAINFGAVSLTTTPVAAVADDAVWVEGPAKVAAGQTFTASLRLSGSGALLGLSAALGWNRAVAELVSVEAGELVTSQGGVALSGGGGLVDCALLGADRRLAGEGELARVTFRALASGEPRLAVGAVDARDGWNRTVELTGTPPSVAPAVTSLAPAMPNPFRGTTTLSYGLAKAGVVELAIYGVDGRKVATLASGEQAAGSYRLVWDGGGLRPGLYYARLATPEGKFTRTIVLVK